MYVHSLRWKNYKGQLIGIRRSYDVGLLSGVRSACDRSSSRSKWEFFM
jgi:hypothetical protein